MHFADVSVLEVSSEILVSHFALILYTVRFEQLYVLVICTFEQKCRNFCFLGNGQSRTFDTW